MKGNQIDYKLDAVDSISKQELSAITSVVCL